MEKSYNLLIFLVGITGSGKSRLAHQIALDRNLKILSLDSMAVYKNLDILSDKPSQSMQEEVEYYGLDIVDENIDFSVYDYLNYLSEMQLDKLSHEEEIIAVGGTGLYFNAIVNNYNLKKINPKYRSHLEKLSLDNLQEIYIQMGDDKKNIDINNKRRLIRFIESNNELEIDNRTNFRLPTSNIGVFWDHPNFIERIENRTYKMIDLGLIDEVRNINSPSRTIQQAIGYKDALNEIEEEKLIAKINYKTLRLVKKQRTWFKKINNLIYLNTDSDNKIISSLQEISNENI